MQTLSLAVLLALQTHCKSCRFAQFCPFGRTKCVTDSHEKQWGASGQKSPSVSTSIKAQKVTVQSGWFEKGFAAAWPPDSASSVVFSTSSNSRRMTPLSKSRWPLTLQQMAQRQLHRCTTVSPRTIRWGTGWSRVECCRISARMSTPFHSSKFSQILGLGSLVLCKNRVGIWARLRHCYAGSSETQWFASNKCEPSRAPCHCASQS